MLVDKLVDLSQVTNYSSWLTSNSPTRLKSNYLLSTYLLQTIIELWTLYWQFLNLRNPWKAWEMQLLLPSFLSQESEAEPETVFSKLICPVIHFTFFLKDLATVSLHSCLWAHGFQVLEIEQVLDFQKLEWSWLWSLLVVIMSHERPRQEDWECQASLGYIEVQHLKQKKTNLLTWKIKVEAMVPRDFFLRE